MRTWSLSLEGFQTHKGASCSLSPTRDALVQGPHGLAPQYAHLHVCVHLDEMAFHLQVERGPLSSKFFSPMLL